MKFGIFVTTALLTALNIAGTSILPGLATSGDGATHRPEGDRNFRPHPLQLAQNTWQVFTSEDGKFSIQMPGQPQTETASQEIAGESVDLYQIGVQKSPEEAFVVMYADLPNAYTEGGADAAFDRIGSDLLGPEPFAKLKQRQQQITLDGNPGREFRINNSGNTFVMRMYLVGQRSYLLLTQSKQATEVNQFLDSFQLL